MKDELFNKKICGWLSINENEKVKIFNFSEGYLNFLNSVKTEREAVKEICSMLINAGFMELSSVDKLSAGDKVYYVNNSKTVYAAVIGSDAIVNGVNLVGAHIDSPRLDLKPNPIYEDAKLALFDTHYYGGIKKYQWTTIPLAIHGVVVKPDGTKIDINIGEAKYDPVFTVTDLLPHLSQEQNSKKLSSAISGEDLNVLVGSIPLEDEEDSIKRNMLKILNKKYGISEIDFYSAEIELVPAFKARSLGIDSSMIGAYGQDDRVCAYDTLQAIINASSSEKTKVVIFADKEEIGSMGNTGMSSEVFDCFMNELLTKTNSNTPGALNKTYCFSKMLSADVGAGVDPNYQSASEKKNASFIGYGVELNKYTGGGGKSGASDANAEFVAEVRNIFEKNNIKYQMSELGKVDLGGGGTIAYILANKGVNVIDCGVPVISMHSPYEVTSKYDVYSAYEAYKAFLEN